MCIHGQDGNASEQLVGLDGLENSGDVLHQAGVQEPLPAGFTIGHTTQHPRGKGNSC